VRSIVMVIADLYLPPGDADAGALTGVPAGSAPGIEQAGRFGARAALTRGWREWLAGSLGRHDLAGVAPAWVAAAAADPAGAGPAAQAGTQRAAAGRDGAPATKWIASPLQLLAGPAGTSLDHRGVLRLPRAPRAALAAAFTQSFATPGLALTPLTSGEFLLETPGIAPVETTEPARCAGAELASALPRGSAAAPLRRLVAELEMWLHGGALNAERVQRREPPVTTLWPWGGAGRAAPPARRTAAPPWLAFGSDAYLAALWHLEGSACAPLPRRLGEVLAEPAAQGAVLVLEMGGELQADPQCTPDAALARLDALFVTPALQALRSGELESLTLIANDVLLRLDRRSRLRFWRRRRTLAETLA
jgi:hypothetical protein